MSFEKFNSIFKKISFVILILVVLTMPISNIVNRISSSKHDSIIEQFGAESAEAKAHEVVTILNCIYKINCMLCVISIITFLVYIGFRLFKFKNIKITKAKIIKKLPLLILAVFMALTLVGCL